jgi:hypothetical protein
MKEANNKLVFMDFNEGKIYQVKINSENELYLSELDSDIADKCIENIDEQRKILEPKMPIEAIRNVLNTEKDLSVQNENHIFRRDFQ